MSGKLIDVRQIRACDPYSLGFANRLTYLTSGCLRIPKERLSDLIHEMLRECAARQDEDLYHPIRAIRQVADEIAQTASERDPGPLLSYIDKLPEPDRTILELRMAGLSYRETAQRLGLERDHVLEVLASRTAAMAAIDACAQPIKRTCKVMQRGE
jgi:hypothetical protein